jgi:hypothetical protein
LLYHINQQNAPFINIYFNFCLLDVSKSKGHLQEDDSIYRYGAVCFTCIGISSLVSRTHCCTYKAAYTDACKTHCFILVYTPCDNAIAVNNNNIIIINNNNSVEASRRGKVNILWSQQLRTDRTIPNNKPDIVISDNGKRTSILIDVAIPEDRNVIQKEDEKILKYKDLTIEIQRMWNVKTRVIPVIIGATGTISK